MVKKIRSCVREKGLLDPMYIIVGSSLTKEIITYPNSCKPKSPHNDLYDGTKDSIDYVQIFQSYTHYVGAFVPYYAAHS